LAILIFSFILPVIGQKKEDNDKEWNFTVAPYIILPNMNGDIGMGGIEVDVSANPGDIFSNLDFGAMLYFEASTDKFAFTFDLLYMDLGKDGTTPILERDVRVDVDQLAITISGLYRIAPWAEIGIGGRINSLGSQFKIAPGEIVLPGQKLSMDETWLDPLIVTRAMTRFNNSNWRLGLLASVGGFGLGSDFTWEVNPFGGYQFSDLFEISAAYRWLGMNYETGSGSNRFLYDMVISGPQLGLLFHF